MRFSRALESRLLFEHKSSDSYLAKFVVKSQRAQHAIEHQLDSQRANYASELQLLEQYQQLTLKLLSTRVNEVTNSFRLRSQLPNFSPADQRFVQRLMTDVSITIKPADKNLGLVLVSTDWYTAELTRMLSDRVTYEPLRHFAPTHRGKTVLALPKLQEELCSQLKDLATKLTGSLELWNPDLSKKALRYLTGAVTLKTCVVPKIYLLIKVHKASGLSGRPIVPSTHWVTTPASVLVDHLLQEIMREARIPHIVKDTKSFINDLETLHTTVSDGTLVTADIASLYTNIDTKHGLTQVRRFLIEQKVSARHMELIMSLLEFVMNNSYLTFRDGVWHQVDGTAMGTACAPTYANIVVYMREKDVLHEMRRYIFLYRRFLDDVFVYMAASGVKELQARLNGMHPKIRFDFVIDTQQASFLDLCISKGDRFRRDGRFDLSVHQKKMNLYLYIPYRSFHTDAMKRSFIQTELMRYIRNSSSADGYYSLRGLFFQRLRDRGYPSSFLLPIFNSVFYDDRPFFLWTSAELLSCPQLQLTQPRSTTLLRRLARLRAAEQTASADKAKDSPLVFVIPYSPLSHELPTRSLLSRHWQLVREALNEPSLPPPTIAYQSATSLVTQLVFRRAKQLEKAAAAATPTAAIVAQLRPQQQTLMRSFVVASAVASSPAAVTAAPR